VIKLGGSLLDWPEMPRAFSTWLAQQTPADNAVVVGGGKIVDALRELDRAGSLGEEAAHWLAIEGMGLTAALAVELLPNTTLVRSLDELAAEGDCSRVCVLEVAELMRADAQSEDPLPCSWQVTSDSIAARVAKRMGAFELVLLKSSLPQTGCTRNELAATGYVDGYFPQAAFDLAVRGVNLRAEGVPEDSI
jgi:aspartokinase-like uncharacterized kinase